MNVGIGLERVKRYRLITDAKSPGRIDGRTFRRRKFAFGRMWSVLSHNFLPFFRFGLGFELAKH